MKNILAILLLTVVSAFTALGQTAAEKRAWVKEMTQAKHTYMTQELKLTPAQQQRFFPLYDAMDTETRTLFERTKAAVETVEKKGDRATDAEKEAAARTLFEVKGKENAIEMTYFPKFKEILTPTQLLKLKKAERHFNHKMIKEHRKRKHKK